MRKTALLCLCACLLFTAAVCFCSCKAEGGTAALSEDAAAKTKVGIVAYLYSVGEDSADIMKNAVSDELSERLGGTAETEYMALRDTGEVRDVLEMMCRGCDAVITLDNTSTLICAELYGGAEREEYKAEAFFCCADADTSQKAMGVGMSGSTCAADCARALAEIAAACGSDAREQSRKPGIIYNSGSPTAAETVCSVFDSAGLGYAVYAADSTSDLSIASAELCGVGAGGSFALEARARIGRRDNPLYAVVDRRRRSARLRRARFLRRRDDRSGSGDKPLPRSRIRSSRRRAPCRRQT